jgi:hypothetical protein
MASDSDSDDGLCSMGFMFDAANETVLKQYSFDHDIRAALNVIDDSPGAVISGHYLWPASEIMCRFLVELYHEGTAKHPTLGALHSLLHEPAAGKALELGAGCGMCGVVLAQLMDKTSQQGGGVCFTDYDPGVLTRAESNVAATLDVVNSATLKSAAFANLAWGDAASGASVLSEFGAVSLIIGSDVIYSVDIVRPLFQTISQLLSDTTSGYMVMSQSFVYDLLTEAAIEECLKEFGLRREVISDRLGESDLSVKGKVQVFSKL